MTYPPPHSDQPQYGPPAGEPQYPQGSAPYGQQAGYGYPAAPTGRRLSQPVVGWLLLGTGVLLVIGGPMPWATVLGFSVAGTVGGGKATLFFGLVIAAFGLLIGLRQGLLWVSITACVLSVLVILIALGNMGNIKSVARDHADVLLGNTVSIGVGLWLTLLAGLAALALSIVGIVRRPAAVG